MEGPKLSRLSTWREKQYFREGKMMRRWSRTMFPKDVKSKRPLEDVDSLIVILSVLGIEKQCHGIIVV